jgi:GT2 family glycosyltransferase
MKNLDVSRSLLLGAIEKVTPFGISGWVVNLDDPSNTPEIELLINGLLVCEFRTHLMHPELEQTLKLPRGTLAPAGFIMKLPAVACSLGNHTLSLRCAHTHRDIGRPYAFFHRPSFLTVNNSLLPEVRKRSAHQKPQVSAIVLNRDGADCLQALLASLHRYNSVPAEIIVIDHASSDNSHQVVQDWSEQLDIRWEGLSFNDSFSASSNRGAKLARAPHLLFLNNDIVWVQDVLPGMLLSLQQSKQVAVGLKLLRHSGKNTAPPDLARAPVQHLGVRLTLSEHVYWPYECSPENALASDELFAPQQVAAVTAAVMLMRARDFWRLGGFDERYFYGYEDVELCLRATHSGHRRQLITCRNDLVALHRHGHSRLSGRQPNVTRKLSVNQQVFARELGLWAKQAWWQSLLRQDRLICGEPLTVGVVYDDCPLMLTGEIGRDVEQVKQSGQSTQALQAQALAQTWASRLHKTFGQARLLLYPRSAGWSDFSQAHLLWVLAPEWAHRSGSRLRRETGLRADCRAVAVLDADSLMHWANADGSALCAAMVEPGTNLNTLRVTWPTCPTLLPAEAPHALQSVSKPCKRLFIAMHVDNTDRPTKAKARSLVLQHGHLLQHAAEKMGLLVWSETFSAGTTLSPPVAELVVHIWPSSVTGLRREADDLQDALYVAWIADGSGRGSTAKALQGFEQCWSSTPLQPQSKRTHHPVKHRLVKSDEMSVRAALKSALKTVEQRIGRAFSAP